MYWCFFLVFKANNFIRILFFLSNWDKIECPFDQKKCQELNFYIFCAVRKQWIIIFYKILSFWNYYYYRIIKKLDVSKPGWVNSLPNFKYASYAYKSQGNVCGLFVNLRFPDLKITSKYLEYYYVLHFKGLIIIICIFFIRLQTTKDRR